MAALVLSVTGGLPLAASAQAAVTDLYVDKGNASCADAGPGSEAQPYCTVSAAARTVEPGQTVHIADGIYQEQVVLTHSGTPSAPITFTGKPGKVPGGPTAVQGFEVHGVSDIRIAHLEVFSNQRPPVPLDVSGSSRIQLDFLTVAGLSGPDAVAVHLTGQSNDVTLERSWVRNGRVVVDQGATNSVISTNVVESMVTDGIAVDHAVGTTVVSNKVHSSCRAQIVVGGASSRTVLENNIVLDGTPIYQDCAKVDPAQGTIAVAADSTAQTSASYNVITPAPTAYTWGGTSYTTAKDFQAATGQGAHDVLAADLEAANAAAIDSADENAPGELAADILGQAALDAPPVTNSGTGSGYRDRGPREATNPITAKIGDNSKHSPVGHPLDVVIPGSFSSPWFPATATVDFGDGTAPVPVTGPDFNAAHSYQQEGYYTITLAVTDSTGKRTTASIYQHVAVDPLATDILVQHDTSADQLTIHAQATKVTGSWAVTGYHYDFGDGTAVDAATADQAVPHRYAKPGTYQVSVTATDDHERTAKQTAAISVGGAYVPLAHPVRVMDTRSGLGAPKAKVGPDGTVKLKVTGTAGVPADGSVTAVLVNLTATDATEPTHVIAYAGGTRPGTSNLNATPGRDVGNAALVPVAADGTITVYNHGGSIDLIADVQGYYSTANVIPLGLYGVPAVRALDTRDSHAVGPDGTVTFKVRGQGLLPDEASVAVLNLTATDADQDTFVTANPTGRPVAYSSLNVSRGTVVANQITVPIDANGNVTLYNHIGNVQLIADVQGFYGSSPGLASPVIPITPVRALDTRGSATKPAYGDGVAIDVRQFGIPTGATAVLVNLTGLNAIEDDWLAVGRGDTQRWTTSNLNLVPGAIVPNLALVPIADDGTIKVVDHIGASDAIVDIQGYVAP